MKFVQSTFVSSVICSSVNIDINSFLLFCMLSYMVNTRNHGWRDTTNMLLNANMNKDTEMGYQNYYEYEYVLAPSRN
jgi:hypothetical protein